MLLEESSSGGVVGDLASGRDVIGGDGISKVEDAVSVLNIGDAGRLGLSLAEERRVGDVSGLRVPSVELIGARIELLPALRSLEDVAVDLLEHLRLNDCARDLLNLVSGGPDVLKEDILAVAALANGLSFEVDVDSSGECVCHH